MHFHWFQYFSPFKNTKIFKKLMKELQNIGFYMGTNELHLYIFLDTLEIMFYLKNTVFFIKLTNEEYCAVSNVLSSYNWYLSWTSGGLYKYSRVFILIRIATILEFWGCQVSTNYTKFMQKWCTKTLFTRIPSKH